VRRWLKGQGGERLTIRELGYEAQGEGQWISGTPRYRAGEEVFVFLRHDPETPGAYRTYGMAQGKFVLLRGVPGTTSVLRRDLAGLGFATWSAGQMQVEEAAALGSIELPVFLGRVRAALALDGLELDLLETAGGF